MADGDGRVASPASGAAGAGSSSAADDDGALARWWRRLAASSLPPVAVAVWTAVLLAAGLLVDLLTRQTLVVAMLYDIPIAVSGLATSRRITGSAIGVALVANLVAAWENAANVGGWDATVLANRGFAALSFVIVGAMTAARSAAVDEATELGDAEVSAERERDLRHFANAVAGAVDVDELEELSAGALRDLLRADGVVVTEVDDGHFAAPLHVDGGNRLVEEGASAAWAVDIVPTDGSRSATVRAEHGPVTVGRWRREDRDPLIVLADRPQVRRPSLVLGEALDALEPLLRRLTGRGGA